MDIEKQFDFLVKDYDLKYSYQKFTNCYQGNWVVYTYSFYNESGCFTIYNLGQRGEWEYFYTEKFCNSMEQLLGTRIHIYSTEKELWDKVTKSFFYSMRTELKTLATVIKSQIEKTGQFFGIKVK